MFNNVRNRKIIICENAGKWKIPCLFLANGKLQCDKMPQSGKFHDTIVGGGAARGVHL